MNQRKTPPYPFQSPTTASSSTNPVMEHVDLIAQLADIKEALYHNTLLLTAIIEILQQNKICSGKQIQEKVMELDRELSVW